MSSRPAFLQKHHENGETIIAEFRDLPKLDAINVYAFLLVANAFGALTSEERCLLKWANETDPSSKARSTAWIA